jgi:hypothetical protein
MKLLTENMLDLPSSWQFHMITCHGLRPRGVLINLPYRSLVYSLPANEHCRPLPMMVISRLNPFNHYGLLSPIYQLQAYRYHNTCDIGGKLAANLYLPWTFTSKYYQASLGAPTLIPPKIHELMRL